MKVGRKMIFPDEKTRKECADALSELRRVSIQCAYDDLAKLCAFIKRVWNRVAMYFRKEKVVVLTHTPGDWCKAGTVYQWRDGYPTYVFTRIRSTNPTGLYAGGSVPCWEVMGKRIK